NLQLRSGRTIHQREVHQPTRTRWDPDQHGWAWSGHGQHLHRAAVANGEIRGSVSEGLSGRAGRDLQSWRLLSVLQPREAAPGFGQSNAGGSLLRAGEKSRRKPKTSHATGRPSCRSWLKSEPGTKFFGEWRLGGR